MYVKTKDRLFESPGRLLISRLYTNPVTPAAGVGGSSAQQVSRYQKLNKLYSAKMEAIRIIAIASIVWGHP